MKKLVVAAGAKARPLPREGLRHIQRDAFERRIDLQLEREFQWWAEQKHVLLVASAGISPAFALTLANFCYSASVRRMQILIPLSSADTQCLLANAPYDSIALKTLMRAIQSSSTRPNELKVYCDAEAAVEIKSLAMLHCPAAVPVIENAINAARN